MKKLMILLFLSFIFWGCETSFEIEAAEKEIPVVYGVLDINNSNQYIRIERAFQLKGGNIMELVKNPDILYYESGKALLFIPSTGKSIIGNKIDAEKIGIKRQDGLFLQSPNILYEFETSDWKVNPPSKVVFSFESPSLEKSVSSDIPMVKELQLREGVPAAPLNLSYDRIITIGWNNATEAKVFDLVMRINYQEKSNQTNGLFINKSTEWVLKNNLEAGTDPTKGSFSFKGVEFYKFLGNSLRISSDIQRNMQSVDLLLTAGGVAFKEILNLNQANYGLTGSTNIPRYSNITHGIGFLSSRLKVLRPDIPLASVTLDSLKNGVYTKSLQFK